MRADEDDDGRTSAFRCLDVARYTVAAVMTVLIVTVVVISLKVGLHPESPRLSVVHGAVYSTPQPAREEVTLTLHIRAENPSCRTSMYFLNITAYLFDGTTPASTSKPDEDCIIFFPLNHKARPLPPQRAVDFMTTVVKDPDVVNQTYFELLYKGAVVEYLTLRVDGSLVTEVSSRFNMTRLQITYYCWPLFVGVANGRKKDLLCMDNLGSKNDRFSMAAAPPTLW